MADKFPTTFYQSHGIQTAPNGDKLRSDDDGLFFWIDGERVPYPIPAGWVPRSERETIIEPLPTEAPIESKSKSRKRTDSEPSEQEVTGDANG